MKHPLSFHLQRALRAPLLAAALAGPLLGLAQTAAPTLAGPSIGRVAQTASFNGSGFAANAAVTLAVTTPGGTESHHGSVSDANGRLALALTPASAGRHVLRVLDSGGKLLLTLDLQVAP